MLLNYHEMTQGESSNSPAKRKQFAVVCAVMTAAISYVAMTSGIFLPLEITNGIFPGGTFCYKLAHRDYAASMGLGRRVMMDALGKTDDTLIGKERRMIESKLYHLYLDNPKEIHGRRLRWASGILGGNAEQEMIQSMLRLNKGGNNVDVEGEGDVDGDGKTTAKEKRYPTDQERIDLSASQISKMLPYEVAELPSVDSLVLQFPHTHGFGSALVMNYKVIPQLRKMAMEKGGPNTVPIVLATCRKSEQMCTIYAPLVQTQDVFVQLKEKDSATYLSQLPYEPPLFSYGGLKQSIHKLSPPWLREYVEKLP